MPRQRPWGEDLRQWVLARYQQDDDPGYRQIASELRADGCDVSHMTVKRWVDQAIESGEILPRKTREQLKAEAEESRETITRLSRDLTRARLLLAEHGISLDENAPTS